MSTPTPKDMPKRKLSFKETVEKVMAEPVKPPFVRKPHLTDRPLKNDPALLALKAQLSAK